MKLRMAKDSIRFRILRSELEALRAGTPLSETVRLRPGAGGVFGYVLRIGPQTEPVQVQFEACTISVQISPRQFAFWSREEEVGVYEQLDFGNDGSLRIVLEKDFACLDRGEAENQDTFDHPHADAVC